MSGIFEIINAYSKMNHSSQWGLFLFGGIIDLVLGGLLLTHENLTMEILPLFLGFWLLFRSTIQVVMYFDIKDKRNKHPAILLIFAILSSVFAVIILANPTIGVFYIVYATALAFLLIGLFRIVLGFKQQRGR